MILVIFCILTSDDSGDILPNETESKVLIKTTQTFTNYIYINFPQVYLFILICIMNKDEFIRPLHSVSWHYSQSSGSSHNRQKQTEYKKKEDIIVINK